MGLKEGLIANLPDDGNSEPYEIKELDGLGITVEIADLEKDAEAIARIFSQRSVMPHLSAVAPQMLDKQAYQKLRDEHGPILAATPEGVRGYYRRHRDNILLVARDGEDNVVGTVTLQPQEGTRARMIAKLAVDENKIYRRKHVGQKLVMRACEIAFESAITNQIDASLIVGIPGDEAPQRLFRKLGFAVVSTELKDRALSWDLNLNNFVSTNVLRMLVYRNDYFARREQILPSSS